MRARIFRPKPASGSNNDTPSSFSSGLNATTDGGLPFAQNTCCVTDIPLVRDREGTKNRKHKRIKTFYPYQEPGRVQQIAMVTRGQVTSSEESSGPTAVGDADLQNIVILRNERPGAERYRFNYVSVHLRSVDFDGSGAATSLLARALRSSRGRLLRPRRLHNQSWACDNIWNPGFVQHAHATC